MSDEQTVAQRLKELAEQREAIQARRQARADGERLAYAEQEVLDLARIDELEEQHGDKRVAVAPLKGWTPKAGAATRIAVVVPKRSDRSYQRFQRLVIQHRKNATKSVEAIEQLGRMALAYPSPTGDKELYEATLEIAPVMLNDAATMAQDLAGADEEADAKKSTMS